MLHLLSFLFTQLSFAGPTPEDLFAVKPKAIMAAPCKGKTPPSEESMRSVVAENESRHPKMFQHLTTEYTVLGTRKGPVKDFSSPDCSEVLCSMEKIWGKKMALRLAYIYLQYGLNASDLSFSETSRFSQQELDDVLIALQDLPEAMVRAIPLNKQLSRSKRTSGVTQDNLSLADGSIMLYDLWSAQEAPYRHYTIFHEVAHSLGTKDRLDSSAEWMKLHEKKKCQVSKYGATDPAEDFAETAAMYRYDGKRLWKKCSEKYDFMKKLLKVDYL